MIGETISLPALATAHSHAFQRALRGGMGEHVQGYLRHWPGHELAEPEQRQRFLRDMLRELIPPLVQPFLDGRGALFALRMNVRDLVGKACTFDTCVNLMVQTIL